MRASSDQEQLKRARAGYPVNINYARFGYFDCVNHTLFYTVKKTPIIAYTSGRYAFLGSVEPRPRP